jgi:hypothetical protein
MVTRRLLTTVIAEPKMKQAVLTGVIVKVITFLNYPNTPKAEGP